MQYAGGNLTAWRWVMLVGMVVPSYWVGEGCALALEACIEWNFFENRRVLYYFLGTTVRPPPLSAPHLSLTAPECLSWRSPWKHRSLRGMSL